MGRESAEPTGDAQPVGSADAGASGELGDSEVCALPADAPPTAEPWAVYLLACRGGKSYIGISPRPLERYEAHVTGRGAAFTRANPPEALAAIAWFADRGAAASMEARLKMLARPDKLRWFSAFPVTSASVPATLDDGLRSLERLR